MKRTSNDTLLIIVGLALFLAFTRGLYLGAKLEARIQEQLVAHRAAVVENSVSVRGMRWSLMQSKSAGKLTRNAYKSKGLGQSLQRCGLTSQEVTIQDAPSPELRYYLAEIGR